MAWSPAHMHHVTRLEPDRKTFSSPSNRPFLQPSQHNTYNSSSTSPTQQSPDHSRQTFCKRCCLSFCCRELYLLHIELALEHNLCIICHYTEDFETFTELQDHIEEVHLWCEPCNWHAPSYEGLMQHFKSKHMMCSICKETFKGLNELTGHANAHRPLTVTCFLCGEAFALRSAAFNHVESEKCPGGALREDIQGVVKEFWEKLPQIKSSWIPENQLFTCQTCHRSYKRMSDLLQHVETRACPEGYCMGNGITERMVQYVQENLKSAIVARLRREAEQQAGEEAFYRRKMVHPRVFTLRAER